MKNRLNMFKFNKLNNLFCVGEKNRSYIQINPFDKYQKYRKNIERKKTHALKGNI